MSRNSKWAAWQNLLPKPKKEIKVEFVQSKLEVTGSPVVVIEEPFILEQSEIISEPEIVPEPKPEIKKIKKIKAAE